MIKGRSGGEGIDSEPPHHAGSTQNMLMNHAAKAAARPHRRRGGGERRQGRAVQSRQRRQRRGVTAAFPSMKNCQQVCGSRRKGGPGVPQGSVLVPPPLGSQRPDAAACDRGLADTRRCQSHQRFFCEGEEAGGSRGREWIQLAGRRKDEERRCHPETEAAGAAGAEDSAPVDQDYTHVASGRQHPRLHTGGT